MYKPPFVEDEIYHIYNRGVEKRNIFLDDEDYLRFIHNLFEFNDIAPAGKFSTKKTIGSPTSDVSNGASDDKKRKLIVEILVFTLMPNHFHLILKQKVENGIVKFMQKLGTGYANYFNKKYKRVGGLFQGKFKAVVIEKESYFEHISFYIHANPLKYLGSPTSETSEISEILFLEKYRWSSFLDYIGKKNFPSITSRELFLDFFGSEKKYLEQTKQWVKERKKNFEKIQEIVLE